MSDPDDKIVKNCYICNREIFRAPNPRVKKERRSIRSVCCSRRCSKKYGYFQGTPEQKLKELKLKMDKFTERPTRKSKKRENKKHPYKKIRKETIKQDNNNEP